MVSLREVVITHPVAGAMGASANAYVSGITATAAGVGCAVGIIAKSIATVINRGFNSSFVNTRILDSREKFLPGSLAMGAVEVNDDGTMPQGNARRWVVIGKELFANLIAYSATITVAAKIGLVISTWTWPPVMLVGGLALYVVPKLIHLGMEKALFGSLVPAKKV